MDQPYKVLITEKAEKEIESLSDFYYDISKDIWLDFLVETENASSKISLYPNIYKKRYKDFRRVNFIKFPVMIVFLILEEEKTVKVISAYHQSSDPVNFYK